MKKIIGLVSIFIMFLTVYSPSAFALVINGVFDVYAEYNSTSTGASDPTHPPSYPTAALNTGIDILSGDIIDITASGQWSPAGGAGGVVSGPYVYGPNGNTQIGWLFPHFSLVGKISGQAVPFYESPLDISRYFFIGSSLQDYEALANGRLFLAFNDSDYGNNAGYVTANVVVNRADPVPEPTTLSLLGLGLLGLVFKRRKKICKR